ncbi:MAG: transglycosylase SLT domain-containing protein [Patescibacteria group bacterium]|nr:transglycosylase SLT domain-containing protein [Patescibacteria group bacterium]
MEKEKLRSIAYCESKFNPNAINGDYCGLFQFSSDTWQSTRREMGLDENPDLRFNPEEAIKTAAFKISRGGINSWRNCLK